MMKNLLTITALAVTVSLSAQSNRKAVVSSTDEIKLNIKQSGDPI